MRLTHTLISIWFALALPLLLAGSPSVAAEPDASAAGDRAEIISADTPESMEMGQSYSVTVKVKNTGGNTWTRAQHYALGARQRNWSVQRVELENAEKIAPGDTATFKFRVTAPQQSGSHDFQWQMQHDEHFFGPPTSAHRVVVEGGSNRVKFISQVVPSAMNIGGEYTVMVQFKNLGKTTWSSANGFMLMSQNPANNRNWGTDRVKLDGNQSIPPGEVATIRFKITAPLRAGEYDFQWQLYQDKLGFFGERTPNQRVVVGGAGRGNDAEFVLQELAGLVNEPTPYAVLTAGHSFPVKVMFKNTGTTAWKPGQYRLTAQKPANNLTWLLDRVELNPKEDVKPGEFKTFSFNAVAPAQPGIYDFEWQMFQDGIGTFGKPSQTVKITVR